jgi:hypothetical protein
MGGVAISVTAKLKWIIDEDLLGFCEHSNE